MGRRIDDIFEIQEAEDRTELLTNYANVVRREFKDAETVLSNRQQGIGLWTDGHLVLSRVPVRIATEFSIRKHTTIQRPYYHSHDFYEMIYVYQGIGKQYINDDEKEVILHRGEACLITPGAIHAVLPAGEGDIVLKMVMPVKMFRELWQGVEWEEVCFFPVTADQDGTVRWLFTKLLEELYFGKDYGDGCGQIAIKSYLTLLFVTFMRSKVNFLENGLLYQVSKQMRDHLKDVQLGEVAENMGYSSRHLERLLREKAGCTFSDVLQKLRMEKAVQLLIDTGDTLEQIAEAAGYQTEAGFYKRFRTVFGMTPGQYRKLHMKG